MGTAAMSQAQADYETLQQCVDDLADARIRQQQLVVEMLSMTSPSNVSLPIHFSTSSDSTYEIFA
jgi:hypothetical protein